MIDIQFEFIESVFGNKYDFYVSFVPLRCIKSAPGLFLVLNLLTEDESLYKLVSTLFLH